MALDSKYVTSVNLLEYFVDKNTGFPLSEGTVDYFSDINRTVRKNVYTISGNAPNYTYTVLPNPITLSTAGFPADVMGNKVKVYYLPYVLDIDGNPTDVVENYYVVAKDKFGAGEYTWEAIPNEPSGSTGTASVEFINYIPNGQFLYHYDIPATDTQLEGRITQLSTTLGPGLITFDRQTNFSEDYVTFERFDDQVAIPTASPRYSARFRCASPNSGDTFKDLRIKFPDVNKFASATQDYRIYLCGQNNNSGTIPIQVRQIRNFGAGGSSTVDLSIGVLTFTTAWSAQQLGPVILGDNSLYTLGDDNQDYLQLAFRFPVGSEYDLNLDSMVFCFDNGTILAFPLTPDNEMSYEAITGQLPTPPYDGSDLYLPLIRTKDGIQPDYGQVGQLAWDLSTTANSNYNLLMCDGSMYKASDYSALGIPYKRLQTYFFTHSSIPQIPQFGTGIYYLTCYRLASTDNNLMLLSTNKQGVETPVNVGATTFTTSVCTPGFDYNYFGFTKSAQVIVGISDFIAATYTSAVDHTSGALTVQDILGVLAANNVTYYRFQITVVSAPAAGTYITFPENYYLWFKVDGAGTDPAPSGYTGTFCNLKSGISLTDVANCIKTTLGGFTASYVSTVAGSTLPGGSYLSVFANSQQYVIWYNQDGTSTKPTVSGAVYVEVDYSSSDTDTVVSQESQLAINSLYFAVPNFQGMFPRVWQGNGPDILWDQGNAERLGPFTGAGYMTGNILGSFELDDVLRHSHTIPNSGLLAAGGSDQICAAVGTANTGETGIYENLVKNFYVNVYIRY